MEEKIKIFYEEQLKNWKLAKQNFESLRHIKKKPVKIGGIEGYIQYNRARAVSTLAKVDSTTIESRKCFLCQCNRPLEQKKIEILPGWELLVNPFPIFPYHFTIASTKHVPQKLDLDTGISLAKKLTGLVVFYNDSGAGASAPDHSHFQAVPIKELPLIKFFDKGIDFQTLPFKIETEEQIIKDSELPVNLYFWQQESGEVRFIAVKRTSHRPKEYYQQPPKRRAVSPGAIDIAGVIVTPKKEDFEALTDSDIFNIYKQVTLQNE